MVYLPGPGKDICYHVLLVRQVTRSEVDVVGIRQSDQLDGPPTEGRRPGPTLSVDVRDHHRVVREDGQ